MMDDTCHSELTILINNLRLKKEIDPNTQASINTEYFQRNLNSITYQAGELIMFENYKKLGLIIQTNPDSLKVLNEQNHFETVKIQDVRRKIEYKPRQTVATDSENNVITRGTMVKIRDRSSPLRGQLGEIRAMFKDVLYLWIKNTMLQNSNGFYCVTSKQVISAGAQHLKEVNESLGLAADDIQANLDRQRRDSLLRNALVQLTRGPLKGYKGAVVFANEEKVEVHIHSKNMKITVPR